jgi:hypothetical protein
MPQAACSESDFVILFEKHGPYETAKQLGVGVRSVFDRRVYLEKKLGRQITGPPGNSPNSTRHGVEHPQRACIEVENGIVLVGSDAHIWPGPLSTAFRGLLKFCKDMKPRAVILNGDVCDFASNSRHPPIGWEKQPTVQQEIEAAQDVLHKLEMATPKGAERVWTLGNHDARFETRLATVAPEYAKVHGVHLRDHFPLWRPAWSCWVNDSVVIKHRFKGGMHATQNNTLWAGKTMVTGHLHSARVTAITDYNGTRWGVDTGCLANPDGPQFVDYTEDNPKNWRSAFGVLTFHKGRLLQPELALVHDADTIDFRGSLVKL